METLNMMSIRELFVDEKQYIVPIYQRDYAWTSQEAQQLIDDIRDYIRDNKDKSYYIGSLVVYKKGDNLYEVVDGQQRFTTLTIMLQALKNSGIEIDEKLTKLKLSFEHRAQSTQSLKELGKGDTGIDNMYHYLYNNLKKVDDGDRKTFCEYLLENVKILLTEVPQDTDLNHYFEIMNTRGEQLEKHEVLKARLMSMLKYDDSGTKQTAHSLFNIIWEACADMDSYAMMNIKADIRKVLYGDDSNVPQINDYDMMLSKIIESNKQAEVNKKATIEEYKNDCSIETVISQFLSGKNTNLETYEIPRDDNNEEKPERFKSIINFPNFLLQVLSVYVAKEGTSDKIRNIKISLDDKQLLQSFEKVENNLDEKEKFSFPKDFIVCLLRVRSLFDIYILKSDIKEDKGERWKIQKYDRKGNYYKNTFEKGDEESEDNEKLEMIESMFHFSHTSNTYKNWLNAALKYVEKADNEKCLDSENYYNWLHNLAKSFMKRNYLAKEKSSFEEIINDCLAEKNDETVHGISLECLDLECLDKGCEVENFIFNFYDFVVWEKDKASDNKKYSNFKFTYRNSVEHFYPQHPIGESDWLDKDYNYDNEDEQNTHKQHKDIVDKFGNLCLISSGMNSKFSNSIPTQKTHFVTDPITQSIKLQQLFDRANEWNEKAIKDFTEQCKNILKEVLVNK